MAAEDQIGGRIRLVKGAFYESDSTALSREDPELAQRFGRLARRIVDGGGSAEDVEAAVAAFVAAREAVQG